MPSFPKLADLPWPTRAELALSPALERFAAEDAPPPARMMAAKGLVPLQGLDLCRTLAALCTDDDAAIASAAETSLRELPDAVATAALSKADDTAILDALARAWAERDALIHTLAQRPVSDACFTALASTPDPRLLGLLADNQSRMLQVPQAIEALYFNAKTPSHALDRLLELAHRKGVELAGVPSLDAHVKALAEEPPESAAEAAVMESAITQSQEAEAEDAPEALPEKKKALSAIIANMNMAQRIRMATVGNASARAILVRDPVKPVALAAIKAPAVSVSEAAAFAKARDLLDEVIRYISNKREWIRHYEIKHALVCNPKTPIATALRFLPHLRHQDVKHISKNRNVSAAVKSAALQRIKARQ